MYKGIDCATPLTAKTAAAAKAAGYDFAGRYLVPATGTLQWKALTKAEAEAITGAGLRLLTVWETTASRALEGAGAGRADGRRALECARAITMPEDGAIYFAVDYDAPTADHAAIAAYLEAAAVEIRPYRAGVYGGYRTVEAMYMRSACECFWQCVAWSGGKKSEHRHVYQSHWSGSAEAREAARKLWISVDLNECEDMDKAGIWTYAQAGKAGDKEEEMDISKLTDKECYEIVEKAQRHAATLKPSAYAEAACKKGVASGLFSDGNSDGYIDNAQGLLKRQDLAVVMDRKGMLG